MTITQDILFKKIGCGHQGVVYHLSEFPAISMCYTYNKLHRHASIY